MSNLMGMTNTPEPTEAEVKLGIMLGCKAINADASTIEVEEQICMEITQAIATARSEGEKAKQEECEVILAEYWEKWRFKDGLKEHASAADTLHRAIRKRGNSQ